MNFSDEIQNWYFKNKRELPWRSTRNPYYIWLSEIILQQTRVSQGRSYYQKFISQFPKIEDLASASEDNVLKLWQGLGYYSRARNLHSAAKTVVIDKNGRFPGSYSGLKELKGVGEYTAAAVASIAYDEPVAAVDGNVSRVLSRYFGEPEPVNSTSGKRRFKELADAVLDKNAPGNHNQAMMEFGSLQCTPRNPNCMHCPLSETCYAYLNQQVRELPVKLKKKPARNRYFDYFVIEMKDSTWLTKRNGNDIWKGLYEFPLVESDRLYDKKTFIENDLLPICLKGAKFTVGNVSRHYKHVLTHQRIHARFWKLILDPATASNRSPKGVKTVPIDQIGKYAVPRLIDKYLSDEGLV